MCKCLVCDNNKCALSSKVFFTVHLALFIVDDKLVSRSAADDICYSITLKILYFIIMILLKMRSLKIMKYIRL